MDCAVGADLRTGKSKSNGEIQRSFSALKSGFAVGVEEGNRRFPTGMTNKGHGRLYENCYFAPG